MISTKTILTAGLLTLALPHLASAQALKGVKTPANLPPVGYNGVQFVDYDGCIFVRAGRLGDVSWVPRIDQSRKHMCSSSYASTFPKADGTPVEKPAVVTSLDRGKVAYKGDVVKPVGAPDTSLVETKEASPSAAQKAKQAAADAANAETAAKLAAQDKAANKLRQDAIAKKKIDDTKKAQQLASAMKAAEEAAKVDENVKSLVAQKIAEDKQARLAKRTADKEARAAAFAQKKADAKAARLAKTAKRDADRKVAADKRAEVKAASIAEKSAAKAAARGKVPNPIVVKEAQPVDAKPVKIAQSAKDVVGKTAKKAAALKEAASAAKQARAQAAAEKKVAKAKADAAKATAFPTGYYVDLGSTLTSARADAVTARLLASGYRVQTRVSGKGTQVFVGPFRTQSNARVAFYQVTNEGFKRAKVTKK
jgi:hypothetical protein